MIAYECTCFNPQCNEAEKQKPHGNEKVLDIYFQNGMMPKCPHCKKAMEVVKRLGVQE